MVMKVEDHVLLAGIGFGGKAYEKSIRHYFSLISKAMGKGIARGWRRPASGQHRNDSIA